ncbi:MAG TPA: hypothetical protein VK957_09195 [Lunatimonas sp.]|nr:hypothetical protein [Lunatimonas sp.]
MKTKILLSLMFFCCALHLSAQTNLLLGAWEANDGEQKEIKIFTPTHFMFFIQNLKVDSLTNGGGGTYSATENKLTENLMAVDYTSFLSEEEQYKQMKAEYDIKVEGDKFYQTGNFIISDTSQVPINHVFVRIKTNKSAPDNPALGAWNQLSSSGTSSDGNKWSHTNASHTRFQLITPTHWIRTSAIDKTFESIMGGSYTVTGNKMTGKLEFASFPLDGSAAEITQRVEGNKLYWSGIIKDKEGKQVMTFEDVFEKAIPK